MTETCDIVRLLREESMKKSTVAIKGLHATENVLITIFFISLFFLSRFILCTNIRFFS